MSGLRVARNKGGLTLSLKQAELGFQIQLSRKGRLTPHLNSSMLYSKETLKWLKQLGEGRCAVSSTLELQNPLTVHVLRKGAKISPASTIQPAHSAVRHFWSRDFQSMYRGNQQQNMPVKVSGQYSDPNAKWSGMVCSTSAH